MNEQVKTNLINIQIKMHINIIYNYEKNESVIWFGLSVVRDGPFHFHASLRKITEMTGATSGEVTAYPSRAPEFTLGFLWVPVTRSLVFCR